jgi:phosphatidylethanolamine/phosphatidyl-N-methylethanolamine N-methyltransferase
VHNSTGSFYNCLSFFYPAIDYFLKRHKEALLEEINGCVPGKLLEIGIGNGSHLSLYRSHQIVAIDISEAMLRKARRFKSEYTQLLFMNGENLLFPEASFDYVVICHVLAVTKDPEQLLKQIYKVLKPGGRLFILNHFTPVNWLRYVDWAFQPVSSLFHFKSSFHLADIKELQRFSLHKQTELGKNAYYKLLIFSKP